MTTYHEEVVDMMFDGDEDAARAAGEAMAARENENTARVLHARADGDHVLHGWDTCPDHDAFLQRARETVTVSWIALGPPGTYDVEIDVTVRDGRALVDEDTLRAMAAGVLNAHIASLDEDVLYATDILRLPRRADDLYDVTDEPALEDRLRELGLNPKPDGMSAAECEAWMQEHEGRGCSNPAEHAR